MLRRQLLTGLLMTAVLTVLLGLIFPMAVWGVSQLVFKDNANGSFVTNSNGRVVGSSLIGQSFVDANGNPIRKYFQPRPSAAGTNGYDPLGPSGGTNLGPSNSKLLDAVTQRVAAYRELNGLGADVLVPVDAVTSSSSGSTPTSRWPTRSCRPHASHASATSASDRPTRSSPSTPKDRAWGFLGEKVVNVLELNLDLDQQS